MTLATQGGAASVERVGEETTIDLTGDTTKHCDLLRSRAGVRKLQIKKADLAYRLATTLAARYDSSGAPTRDLDEALNFVT